jgi:hypothetical protein
MELQLTAAQHDWRAEVRDFLDTELPARWESRPSGARTKTSGPSPSPSPGRSRPDAGRASPGRAFQPRRRVISSVSAGTTLNKSPTMPKSARSKIGASGSLLIAAMTLEVCMPARCWMAPEIPIAR